MGTQRPLSVHFPPSEFAKPSTIAEQGEPYCNLVTRYDKTMRNYSAMVAMASVFTWLRLCEQTLVANIAAAIEEQSTVTRHIANDLAQASAGVRDANQRVTQSADTTQHIASDLVVMNQSAEETATGVDQVNASAEEMSRLAEHQNQVVHKFRL